MHLMFLLTDSHNVKEYVLIHLNIGLKGHGAKQIHSNAFNANDTENIDILSFYLACMILLYLFTIPF